MHGPNGFYRQFTGTGPDLAAAPAGPDLRLKITSSSRTAERLELAEVYSGQRSIVRVPAHGSVTVTVRTAGGHGWYDLSVTSDTDPGYLRRLAGHVETGRPSISDPALGTAA